MKLINLIKCYVYEPIKIKTDGEVSTNWKYKGTFLLNKQQDVNELDKNMAGYIDYEIAKLRTDKVFSIKKNDGISFEKLKLDEEQHSLDKPSYIVAGSLTVGRSTTYTINTYHGE